MHLLGITGSTARASTSTALLHALQKAMPRGHVMSIYDRVGQLPIFSPDQPTSSLPAEVVGLTSAVAMADGIVIVSPEYVRSIPGGLKNAIDWLVPREEIVGKPIVLAHASTSRGDNMLNHLRNNSFHRQLELHRRHLSSDRYNSPFIDRHREPA